MKINQTIRQRRQALGLTQEQLAQQLGVSAQAVHKWESAASYPDITLLPPLARLLGVDLNTLLCFQDDLTPRQVAQFVDGLIPLLEEQGFPAAFQAARQKVQEFPRCDALALSAALTLEGALFLYSQDPAPYQAQLEELYHRASHSQDPAIREQALSMLIAKHLERDEAGQAQAMLQQLPAPSPADRDFLQVKIYNKQGRCADAARLMEQKLLSCATDLHTCLVGLVEAAQREGRQEDAQIYAERGRQTAQLYDLMDFSAYTAALELATAQQDRAACLAALSGLLDALDRPWEPSVSPLYRHLPPVSEDFGRRLLPAMLHGIRTDKAFAFLRDDPAFAALLEGLEAKAETIPSPLAAEI